MGPTPYVSLFSGGMGLDLGLESSGFRAIVCNEIDESAVKTIKANRPDIPIISDSIADVTRGRIEEVIGGKLPGLPLIAGGPPCQAFSVYGKRLGVADARGQLIYEFIRVVDELRPQTFLMENVRGLHSMSIVPKKALKDDSSIPKEHATHGSLLRAIIARLEKIGYRIDCFLVNCVNYGAPQIRERLICIGNRYNLRASFPQPRHSNRPEDNLPPFKTLGEVIGDDFVDPDPDCMDFSERKLKYLAMVPPGGNWRSLPIPIQKESMGKAWFLKGGRSAYWRKLSFEFPSPTVVTMPNHAGTSMCHPTKLRALTAGECAAIQEFPATWVFKGKTMDKYRQIGNAVPVRLGAVAGAVIKELLEKIALLPDGAPPGLPIPSEVIHIRPHVRTRTFWKQGVAYSGDVSYYDEEECDDDDGECAAPRQRTLFD